MDLLQSPLHDRHEALGAKFAEFSGWLMPLEYDGVLKEHAAVRERVGVFDVSHLGKALVRGPAAADFVNACLTNDLGRIGPHGDHALLGGEHRDVLEELGYLVPEVAPLVPADTVTPAEAAINGAMSQPPPAPVEETHEDRAPEHSEAPFATWQ